MNKLGAIAITVFFVIVTYIIMLITVPVMVGLIATANATMVASSNMTNYPGTAGFLTSMPWICWFIPASLGIIVIISILRKP